MNNDDKDKNNDYTGDEPTFLVNVKDDYKAGMLEVLLTDAHIPVLRKYPETGQYLHILLGSSIYGVDLYVPADSLGKAAVLMKEIENPDGHDTTENGKETVFTVRPMCKEDYPDVFQLWERTPGVGLRSMDDSYDAIAAFLEKNPLTCFVAETEQKIVGCILGGHDGRRGHIYHTVVAEAYRRKNIGRALVESVVQSMKKIGILKLSLVTFSDNQQAQFFWESMNWTKRDDLTYYDLSLNDENA